MRLVLLCLVLASITASAPIVDAKSPKKPPQPPAAPSDLMPDEKPALGHRGRFRSEMDVATIIDGQNAIIRGDWWNNRYRAKQGKRAVQRIEPMSETFWLHYPTAELAQGSTFKPTEIMEITGTKQHGSKTLFVLEVAKERTGK